MSLMGRVETVISLPILQLWMAGIVIGFLKQTNNKPRADSHDIKLNGCSILDNGYVKRHAHHNIYPNTAPC